MKLSSANERPWSVVPRWLFLLLPLAILAHTATEFHLQADSLYLHKQAIPPPLSHTALTLVGLGEAPIAARASMFWVQSLDHDRMGGFARDHFDYSNIIAWLEQIIASDPYGSYPMLVATHLYTRQPNEENIRLILDFIEKKFSQQPQRHWRWMTDAAIIARHQLNDLELALRLAERIRVEGDFPEIPSWARQMSVFLLEKMGETEAAAIILGGLIESGVVRDEHEKRFLLEKLEKLKKQENSPAPTIQNIL